MTEIKMIPKKLNQMPTSMAAKEKELRRVETGLFFLILFLLFIAGGADCAAAPSFFTFWCVSFFLYYNETVSFLLIQG